MSETCDYPEGFVDEAIRDRIVVGIRDKALSQSLQLIPDLTLQKVVDKVRQKESVEKQQVVLANIDEYQTSTQADTVGVRKKVPQKKFQKKY